MKNSTLNTLEGAKKIAIIGGSAIGIGLLIHNMKKNNEIRNSHPAPNVIKKELAEYIQAQFIFENILLNEDKNILPEDITDTSYFTSLEFAKQFYFKSNDYQTSEIKEISKHWYLNKLNSLGYYIGTITQGQLNESVKALNKSNDELEKIINFYKIKTDDVITEDMEKLRIENQRLLKELNNTALVHFLNNISQ